jgi:hypothetical protein
VCAVAGESAWRLSLAVRRDAVMHGSYRAKCYASCRRIFDVLDALPHFQRAWT